MAPKWNLCNAPGSDNGGKVNSVGAFLESDEKVLVCPHATFRFAVDRFGVEALDDRLIAVDEFHHVSMNPDNLRIADLVDDDVARRDRIAAARLDPTSLMADVEIVATYTLFNINRARLENLIHRIFDPARLDIAVKDRFGNPVVPREWFLVPLFVIDEAVAKIRDGTIAD